jgi:hypothetical protein
VDLFPCPECGAGLPLTAEHEGKGIQCSSCRATFTYQPAPRPVTCTACGAEFKTADRGSHISCPKCEMRFAPQAEEERIPCPLCAKMIKAAAKKCPHCKAFLEGFMPEDKEAFDERVRKLISEADDPPETCGQPGKMRPVTLVFAILTAACFVPLFFEEQGFIIFGIIMGVALGLASITMVITDLVVPSPKGRGTAQEAAACFLKSIRFGHWAKGHSCLSPIALEKHKALSPDIAEINAVGFYNDLGSRRGFKRYWAAFTRALGTTVRRITGVRWTIEPMGDRLARVRTHMSIEHYNSLILLTILAGVLIVVIVYLCVRKTHLYTFDLLLVKHKSQWWVLTGEPNSMIDRGYRGPDIS